MGLLKAREGLREAFSVGQQMLLDNMMIALTGGAGR
jgi:hypothetical protein